MPGPQAFYYSNIAVPSVLGAGISNSAVSIYQNTTPSGYPGSYPFRLVLFPNGTINEGQSPEVVYVTAGVGTLASPWTVTRGQDGTTASSWSAGASVQHEATAGDFTLSRLHEASVAADLPHGLPASAWLGSSVAQIFSTTLSAASATVVISTIPATYSNLLLVANARCTESATTDYFFATVNGDAGTNYAWNDVATAVSHSSQNGWGLMRIAGASIASPAGGGGFAVFPGYAGSTFNKQFFSMSTAGNASGNTAALLNGSYTPATQRAISSMTFTAPAGSSFAIGSYFALYGLL